MRRLLLGLAALLAAGAAPLPVPSFPSWTRPAQPFHVVGPIYYVGTEGLAVYLIQTRAGLILLDATIDENVPMIERNIAAAGFRLGDVKLLLASHAHFDHVGGMARLKRDTGATLAVSAGDRGALESGNPPSDSHYADTRFAPVKVDRVLADGRPVTLGGITMTPVVTPGHTPGCTTWTMRVTEAGRPLDVVFPCSSLTAAGNVLVGNKGYPGIVADFRRTFTRMRRMHADVVLPPHPELADVLGRARRHDAGDANAWLGPDVLPHMIDQAEAGFNAQLAKGGWQMAHTGHCFCGEVHFTIEADPIGCRMCWCRDCQYIASGSATVNVLFPEEAVAFAGAITTIEKVADSGNTVERGFCSKCGSQMYSRTVSPKGAPIRIRAGTLDDPELMAPTAIIWTDSAPGWAVLDPGLRHHPKAPT